MCKRTCVKEQTEGATKHKCTISCEEGKGSSNGMNRLASNADSGRTGGFPTVTRRGSVHAWCLGDFHRDWGSDLGVPFLPFFLTPYIWGFILQIVSVPPFYFSFTGTLFDGWSNVGDEYEGENGART